MLLQPTLPTKNQPVRFHKEHTRTANKMSAYMFQMLSYSACQKSPSARANLCHLESTKQMLSYSSKERRIATLRSREEYVRNEIVAPFNAPYDWSEAYFIPIDRLIPGCKHHSSEGEWICNIRKKVVGTSPTMVVIYTSEYIAIVNGYTVQAARENNFQYEQQELLAILDIFYKQWPPKRKRRRPLISQRSQARNLR